MTTLPYDVARCSGRIDLLPDGHYCRQRVTCKRYLAFAYWDKQAGVPDYRGIPVSMAVQDCTHKIEMTGEGA